MNPIASRGTSRLVPNVALFINGAPAPLDLQKDLLSFSVNDDLRMASSFTLRLNSWDPKSFAMSWVDRGALAIGSTVDIRPGYVDQTLRSVILGEVSDLELEVSDRQPPVLTVTGYDIRHRLAKMAATKTFNDMTDSAIVNDVLTNAQVDPSVTPTDVVYTHTTQFNETALSFLNRLAWRNNFDLTAAGLAVRFAPWSAFGAPVPLAMGQDLTSFNAAVNASMVVNQVQMAGEDPANNQPFLVSTMVQQFPGTLPVDTYTPGVEIITDLPATSQAEAASLTAARAWDAVTSTLSGGGSGYGNNALRAGVTIKLDGIGQRFSANYRLINVTHAFSPDAGYTTSFRCKGVPR